MENIITKSKLTTSLKKKKVIWLVLLVFEPQNGLLVCLFEQNAATMSISFLSVIEFGADSE